MDPVLLQSAPKIYPQISKEKILNVFKATRPKINSFQPLLDSIPEVFSREVIEPVNYNPSLGLNMDDAFVEGTSTPRPMKLVTKKRIYIPKSPFASSGYIEDPALRVWYYLDETSNVQGPFTSLEMDHWFDNGFLFHELLIRLREKNDFVKLIQLFGKTEIIQQMRPVPFGEMTPVQGDQGVRSDGLNREGQLSAQKGTFYTFDEQALQSPYSPNKNPYAFYDNEKPQEKPTPSSFSSSKNSPPKNFQRNTTGTPNRVPTEQTGGKQIFNFQGDGKGFSFNEAVGTPTKK